MMIGLSAGAARAKEKPVICGAIDLRSAAAGTECVTAQNARFKLLQRKNGKEIWKDLKSGLVWGDEMTERASRKKANAECAKKVEGENVAGRIHASRLPTLDDYAQAESHGFREVLPGMKNQVYWIDSQVPGAANVGHVFNANVGKPFLITYRAINFEKIRCVGKE